MGSKKKKKKQLALENDHSVLYSEASGYTQNSSPLRFVGVQEI